jgi:hypothetical protein
MLRAVKRWIALLATAGGLAAVVWLALPGETPLEPPPEHRAAVVPLPLPDKPAMPAPAASVAAVPASVTTELCGTGRVPLRDAGGSAEADAFDQLPAPVGRLALQELQARLLQALASGNARQRTAAWLLRQPDAPDPAAQSAWAGGLLAEARAGGDAQALRWAVTACNHIADGAQCRRELAHARVQAEPGNGLHWLEWAPEASSAAEREQAWQGVLRASTWHEYPGGLTAVTQAALAALQPVPPAYLRARLARETLGRDSAEVPEGQDWLESQCASNRASCAQVADRMSTEADSVALLLLAAALGRHVGWSEDRLQALAATTQAFHDRLPSWPESARAALGCSAAEPQLAHIQAVAQRGEVPRGR